MEGHDIHDFMQSAQREIEAEYNRIRRTASEDPGTAGDQGEENWASLFRQWLPAYFPVVTKGRILTHSGYRSPQIDLLVLSPSYPKFLHDKKLYLAGGVVAAFECKNTLKAEHIRSAVTTCAEIQRNLPKRTGTPYKELHSTMLYGLLAHSHSWTGDASTPVINVNTTLADSDQETVIHPNECIDCLCVANLATWTIFKMTFFGPKFPQFSQDMFESYGVRGSATTGHMCFAISGECQKDYFSPIGTLLGLLYTKLAWSFHDMRNLEEYFRKVDLFGSAVGHGRRWDITIYSEPIRDRIERGRLSNGVPFDEWSVGFM